MREFIKQQIDIACMAVVVVFILIILGAIVGCSHSPRGDQQELGRYKWLKYADEMDAEYAQQIHDELEAYKAAYKWRTSWSQFWFEQYQRCAEVDVLEQKVEEDHQAEIMLEDANL